MSEAERADTQAFLREILQILPLIGLLDIRKRFYLSAVERAFPLVVADGMGGQNAGEIASKITVEEIRNKLGHSVDPQNIAALLRTASTEINKQSARDSSLSGMGSTVVGAVLQPQSTIVFNVGDSRAYLVTSGNFLKVSVDDVLPGARGSSNNPLRHAVTQSLGGSLIKTRPTPHIRNLEPTPGSILLLCSDGLTDMVGEEKIARLLQSKSVDAAQLLVGAALETGGADNVSVIVVSFMA